LITGAKTRGILGFLLAAYVLFALAPFLLLHSHSDEDSQGSHVETTHAHAWDFWAVHEDHDDNHVEEHHQEESRDLDAHDASLLDSHQAPHQNDVAKGHEGLDFPDGALVYSHPGLSYFHAPPILYMERAIPLPKSALRRLPNQVPIPSHSYPDDAASLLTCDLPPPYLS
jgi:hypothetical protein